jgi:formate/nitrite transporter
MSTAKTSADCIKTVCAIGAGKAKSPLISGSILGFLAGAFIGLGSLFAIKVAGNMPVEYWGNIQRLVFAGVFPTGLLMVVVAGADLFTGNCMYLPGALIHKKTGLGGVARSWILSYVTNFIGAIFVAYALGYLTTLFLDVDAKGFRPLAAYAVNLANGKCALPFWVAFWRAVGCNWLVCMAIYMSLSAPDVGSKILAIWPPITCFVAIGFEHSVANMTFIPLGIFLGSSATYLNNAVPLPALTANWGALFSQNLLPVTLGNILGGALFVALAYYRAHAIKPDAE